MTAPRIGAILSIVVTWTTVGYSAEAVDLKQRFLNEYPAASKKLRRFYGRVQMVVSYTIDGNDNGEAYLRSREVYATNGGCLLRKTIVELSGFEKTGFERVAVANPKRTSFSLQRAKSDGEYVLTGMDEYRDAGGSILFKARPLTATYGYYELTLWRSLHSS